MKNVIWRRFAFILLLGLLAVHASAQSLYSSQTGNKIYSIRGNSGASLSSASPYSFQYDVYYSSTATPYTNRLQYYVGVLENDINTSQSVNGSRNSGLKNWFKSSGVHYGFTYGADSITSQPFTITIYQGGGTSGTLLKSATTKRYDLSGWHRVKISLSTSVTTVTLDNSVLTTASLINTADYPTPAGSYFEFSQESISTTVADANPRFDVIKINGEDLSSGRFLGYSADTPVTTLPWFAAVGSDANAVWKIDTALSSFIDGPEVNAASNWQSYQ